MGEFDRPMEMLRGNSTNPNDILQATSSKIEEYGVKIEAKNPKIEEYEVRSNYKIGKRGLVVEERGISEAGVSSHHPEGGLMGA